MNNIHEIDKSISRVRKKLTPVDLIRVASSAFDLIASTIPVTLSAKAAEAIQSAKDWSPGSSTQECLRLAGIVGCDPGLRHKDTPSVYWAAQHIPSIAIYAEVGEDDKARMCFVAALDWIKKVPMIDGVAIQLQDLLEAA